MVLVGIPVWHSRPTLTKTLDSLVAQTKKMFLVTLSVDADGEDYSDIIEEYKKRGLKISTIYATDNGGPGIARQRVIDSNTMCDYIMFCDADDMLMPRAVEVLYREAKKGNYDVLASSFLMEDKDGSAYEMRPDSTPCTWCHGRIYKADYLRKKNIRFLPNVKINEDSYFNLVAWNAATNKGYTKEVTYLWKFNKQSITHAQDTINTFKISCEPYIFTQVMGLIKLNSVTDKDLNTLISDTILNIYYHFQKAIFINMDLASIKYNLAILGKQEFIQSFLQDGDNWIYMARKVKAAERYGDTIYFYKTPLSDFIAQYIYSPNKEKLLVEGEEKWKME